MKKVFAAVLTALLVLSFSACTFGGKPADESKPFFMLKELPDIGEHESEDKLSYVPGAPYSEFVASESYGGVVPYIYSVGESRYYDYEANNGGEDNEETEGGDYDGINYNLYGMATAKGEIITEGCYMFVNQQTSGDKKKHIYIAESFAQLDKTPEEILEIYNNGEFVESIRDVTFIGEDGSWSRKYEDTEGNFEYKENIDAVILYTKDGVTAVDFDGKQLFYIACPEGYKYEFLALIGDRVILNRYKKEEPTHGEETENDPEEEKPVIVCTDLEGKVLNERKLNFTGYLREGTNGFMYAWYDDEGVSRILDINGDPIIEEGYESIEYIELLDIFLCWNEGDSIIEKYNIRGENVGKIDVGGEIDYMLDIMETEKTATVTLDDRKIFDIETGRKLKNSIKGDDISSRASWGDEGCIYAETKDGLYLYTCEGVYVTCIKDKKPAEEYDSYVSFFDDGTLGYFTVNNEYTIWSENVNERHTFKFDGIEDYEVYERYGNIIRFYKYENFETLYYDLDKDRVVFRQNTDSISSAYDEAPYTVNGEMFFSLGNRKETVLKNGKFETVIKITNKESV